MVDRVASEFRAAVAATYEGHPELEELARAAILPLLRRQLHLANQPGEFGYGLLNGERVPDTYIEVFEVPAKTREVVLASDGHPDITGALGRLSSRRRPG